MEEILENFFGATSEVFSGAILNSGRDTPNSKKNMQDFRGNSGTHFNNKLFEKFLEGFMNISV